MLQLGELSSITTADEKQGGSSVKRILSKSKSHGPCKRTLRCVTFSNVFPVQSSNITTTASTSSTTADTHVTTTSSNFGTSKRSKTLAKSSLGVLESAASIINLKFRAEKMVGEALRDLTAALNENSSTAKLLAANLMMEALTEITSVIEKDVEDEMSETMSTATEASQPDRAFPEAPVAGEKTASEPQLSKVNVLAMEYSAKTCLPSELNEMKQSIKPDFIEITDEEEVKKKSDFVTIQIEQEESDLDQPSLRQ